ncbi:hypothetical protein [Brochothrix campestris]|uniref:hypothetical protein n=1 Tax=Brochothrix campestris TaxID=2757 RepID=UPI0004B488A2|nr:hypothetical protein [Brochothrix campestris]
MSEQKRYRGQGKRQRTQPKQPMETSTTTAGNSRLTKSQRRKKNKSDFKHHDWCVARANCNYLVLCHFNYRQQRAT